jgi:serralysin
MFTEHRRQRPRRRPADARRIIIPSSPLASRRRVQPRVEELEPRLPPAGFQPTAVEQLFLERLNDARANPAAYGASIGLNLSRVAPAQPLAFNPRLIEAAYLHSRDMFTRHYFAHDTPQGITPLQRMQGAGVPAAAWGESIDEGAPGVASTLQELIIDRGIPDLGHRRHLLGIDPLFKVQNQVGIGVFATGPDDPFLFIPGVGVPVTNLGELTGRYFYTIDTAATGQHQVFLTGAVFQDLNGNGEYDLGEGLAGVTITVRGTGSVQDFDSGGYTVPLRHGGTYLVTAHGGSLAAPITRTVHVGASNARLEFVVP